MFLGLPLPVGLVTSAQCRQAVTVAIFMKFDQVQYFLSRFYIPPVTYFILSHYNCFPEDYAVLTHYFALLARILFLFPYIAKL